MLNLTKQLNPKVIDGRVYIDLDSLTDVLFTHCKNASELADKMDDGAMGMMVLGQTVLTQALDDVLGALQAEHGLEVTGTPVRPSEGHTEAS